MAIESFSNTNVRTCFADGCMWFCAKDIAQELGYKDPGKAIRDHVSMHNKEELGKLELQKTPQARTRIYLNANGVRELLSKSQQPNAIEIATSIGVKVESRYIRKESEIIKHVTDYLSELNAMTETQKPVGRYRVD